MADNYLEKKMEELHSGKLTANLHTTAVRRNKPKGKLSGLRAVVTGGANAIGREIAITLKNAGASVDIIDRDAVNGKETAQKHGLKFYNIDISDCDAFENCLSAILKDRGDIDIMVNNAAIADFIPFEDNNIERLEKSLRTNLYPAFLSASIIYKHRLNLPSPNPYGGRIINICSTRALMSEANTENYSITKGALMSLTHSLMMTLQNVGITVNSISPGWIETDPYKVHTKSDMLQHPSRRVGTPADIAKACIYICEKGNDFLNGENIVIDGGMTRKMIYV